MFIGNHPLKKYQPEVEFSGKVIKTGCYKPLIGIKKTEIYLTL
jgi:hypothetical protein